ncbi:MAG: hypothetical protein M1814_005345 [Vezdaea aestivalis]|nr:MAG: hypothetical protein M1814_005345 [Vezdaea aestivalis]
MMITSQFQTFRAANVPSQLDKIQFYQGPSTSSYLATSGKPRNNSEDLATKSQEQDTPVESVDMNPGEHSQSSLPVIGNSTDNLSLGDFDLYCDFEDELSWLPQTNNSIQTSRQAPSPMIMRSTRSDRSLNCQLSSATGSPALETDEFRNEDTFPSQTRHLDNQVSVQPVPDAIFNTEGRLRYSSSESDRSNSTSSSQVWRKSRRDEKSAHIRSKKIRSKRLQANNSAKPNTKCPPRLIRSMEVTNTSPSPREPDLLVGESVKTPSWKQNRITIQPLLSGPLLAFNMAHLTAILQSPRDVAAFTGAASTTILRSIVGRSGKLEDISLVPVAVNMWLLTGIIYYSCGSDDQFQGNDTGQQDSYEQGEDGEVSNNEAYSSQESESEDEEGDCTEARVTNQKKNLSGTKRGHWSLAEDELLIKLKKSGKSWGLIFCEFPERTHASVSSRWYVVLRSKTDLS